MSLSAKQAVNAVWSHLGASPARSDAGKSQSLANLVSSAVKFMLPSSTSAPRAVSNVDLTSPQAYMQSAQDLAMYNTQSSQALAREQMAFQERANAQAMDFSASEAQKVRDWQTMMSNTAHQREVADLLAAGLNPILSANQGAAVGSAPAAQGVTSSGAKGSVDLSAMSALVNIWTQAKQIEMQDKSLDLQAAMNLLNNETNRYMADQSAAASIYGSGVMSSAQRYGAHLSSLASQYAADLNYKAYSEGLHSPYSGTMQYLFEQLFGGNASSAGSLKGQFGNFGDNLKYWFKRAFDSISNQGQSNFNNHGSRPLQYPQNSVK